MMCFSTEAQNDASGHSKFMKCIAPKDDAEHYQPILPGLPDDIAKYCLALIPRCFLPIIATVSKQWRSFIQSKEFVTMRKDTGKLEQWLYILTGGDEGHGSHWEVVRGDDKRILSPMPGPSRVGFEVVVLDGRLLVIGGSVADGSPERVSADVYQYDSRLDSWSKLAKMNVARYDFACAELNGLVYAVGGYGSNGEILSSAEMYDPDSNKWFIIKSLQRPRCGSFAYGIYGKLYVMGGRSSFTIGNSRYVDIYDPEKRTWDNTKNGCVMVVAHAMLGRRLFCIEWKNQRKLAVFDPADNSWKMVPVPVTGSSNVEFRIGTLGRKLLLFPMKKQSGFQTLEYDPDAPAGHEWATSKLKPSGECLRSVTIEA